MYSTKNNLPSKKKRKKCLASAFLNQFSGQGVLQENVEILISKKQIINLSHTYKMRVAFALVRAKIKTNALRGHSRNKSAPSIKTILTDTKTQFSFKSSEISIEIEQRKGTRKKNGPDTWGGTRYYFEQKGRRTARGGSIPGPNRRPLGTGSVRQRARSVSRNRCISHRGQERGFGRVVAAALFNGIWERCMLQRRWLNI